jgi:AraC-like DNA-binding protein
MSENHFIRRFRQAIGLTPASFIQQKRLAAAAQLLLYTDESIDAIALKTGFSDRFYFSRAFRRAMGRPPATYRRLPRT